MPAVLATPIPWRRRWRALAWGVLIMQAVIVVRTAILVLYVVSHDGTLAAMTLGPTADYIVTSLFNAVARSTLSSYVIATFVWIAVCLRSSEWQALTSRLPSSSAG